MMNFTATLFAFTCVQLLSMELPPQPLKLLLSQQVPKAVAQTYLDKLSPDLKGEILSYVKLGKGILNIPAFAQATMAMGDVQDAEKMLGILKSMPTKAASLNLAEKLQSVSAMNESSVQEWLSCIKLEKSKELYETVIKYDDPNPEATIICLLQGSDVDLNWKNKLGWTALYTASFKGRLCLVKLLLEAGADVNATDRHDSTALIESAKFGHADIIKLLLAAGAQFSKENCYGFTALSIATELGHTEVVKLLMEANVNVNEKKENSPNILSKDSLINSSDTRLENSNFSRFDLNDYPRRRVRREIMKIIEESISSRKQT